MSYQTIRFSIDDGVARLVLDRPDKLNSFNDAMHAEIRSALDTLEASGETRCLLLTGAGRGFCAGQDLADRKLGDDDTELDLGHSLEANYNPMVRRLRALPMPVVAAVNGVAAGAGANLALACDIVLAARSAKFIQAFCRLGLVPDCGGSWSLPRLIGAPRATGLALLGEPLDAERAEQWGMIWKCVDDDRLEEEAEALVRHLAQQPTRGLALIKQALEAAHMHSLDEQLDLERDLQTLAGKTADFREGVSAFLEKRTARFQGR